MDQRVTLVRPDDARGGSSALPADLLDRVRGRLGFLALLMAGAFALDPLLFFGSAAVARLSGHTLPAGTFRDASFYVGDAGVVVASVAIWWMSRNRRFPAHRLLAVGLLYEIAVCFVIALRTFWEYYRDTGILPNLTWAPAVLILFPLILPARPRQMLIATAVAGAMPLLALFLLGARGAVPLDADYVVNTAFSSLIAVGFAYLGSRVVHGLGREVAAARELGSYRLEEKLGQGGMGEVWRARHRMLARPAAIKLIRPSLDRDQRPGIPEEAVRRFEREARAIASLRSPHTVELFDFGVGTDGAFFLVMELLDGLDADRLVRRFGPVPAERAVHLLRQVCHSLSEAESRGLVHRDVKPANIFLCRYGEEHDFVKVLDFGIVKEAGDAAENPMDTREGAVRGTPAFIAPEQVLGGTAVDGRADIYATGCVAYWLLTGELVFSADTAMGLLMHHARTAPAPPSVRTTRPIPPALDALVLACLAKDPADRPQTARELSRRLGESVEGEAWSEERARGWWDEHYPQIDDGPVQAAT